MCSNVREKACAFKNYLHVMSRERCCRSRHKARLSFLRYGRLWITGKFMNRQLILGILIISMAPLFAQAQQPNAAELAQNVVSIISGDKAKTQIYRMRCP